MFHSQPHIFIFFYHFDFCRPPVTEVKPMTLPQVPKNETKNGIVDKSNDNGNNKDTVT